jgi:hypothetical protein
MIGYGCCVGSWDKLAANVIPRIGAAPLIAMSGQPGIVSAYNAIIDAYGTTDMLDELDALILVHDDLEITDPDAEAKLLAPFADPDVALVGVAGGGGDSIYWWNHAPIGHQQTDVRLIDFGTREGEVTLIEGSIMVLSPWALNTICFDPRFTGFHGYDEIGMQARSRGKKVVVVDVDTHHHNPEGYASEESAASCRVAAALYQEKWGLG